MNIGFLTDVDGYRAPIHPESFEKYSMDCLLYTSDAADE